MLQKQKRIFPYFFILLLLSSCFPFLLAQLFFVIALPLIKTSKIQLQNNIINSSQTNIKPKYFFEPFAEASVTLYYPRVLYDMQSLPKILSKEKLDTEINILQPHEITKVGDATKDCYLPYLNGQFGPLNQEIWFYHFSDTMVLSENVIVADGNYHLFSRSCHPRYWEQFYSPPAIVTYEYKEYNNVICLGHQHTSDFGHWFLEVLPAYAIMPKSILYNSIVLVPFKRQHVVEGLKLLGVQPYQILAGDNILVFAKHFYTLDHAICGDLNKYLIESMRLYFIQKFNLGNSPPTEYLTFNRPNMSRCIGNYVELRDAIKKRWPNIDWKDGVYHQTLEKQARYFDKVKFVFSVHSSMFANIIFMQANTVVVDLQMEQWLLSFLWLASYTGKYMVVGRDPHISWRGLTPNIVDTNYVIQLFEAAFRVAGFHQ